MVGLVLLAVSFALIALTTVILAGFVAERFGERLARLLGRRIDEGAVKKKPAWHQSST